MLDWNDLKTKYIDKPQMVLNIIASFKQHNISNITAKIYDFIFKAIINSPDFNEQMKVYFNKVNRGGQPFSDFETEPDHVTQIKKVLNALYYSNRAFLDLESLEPDWYLNILTLEHFFEKTIPFAYKACYLITHFDIDLQHIFKDELATLTQFFNQLKEATESHTEDTKLLVENIKKVPISHTIGKVAGTVVNQMKAKSSEEVDIEFLTDFGKKLPGYIDELNDYVKNFSTQFIEKQSGSNKEQLIQLQNTADDLLVRLNSLRSGSLNASTNFLYIIFNIQHIIYIVQHLVTLSKTAYKSMSSLNDSSQDVIREKLALLKYQIFPILFGLVDKIEVNLMKKPGSLSAPLKEKVNDLYKSLIELAGKPVDFNKKGAELRHLEDSRFVAERLEKTYTRIDETNKERILANYDNKAMEQFFALLEDFKQAGKTDLNRLSQKNLDQLGYYYKSFRAYVSKANPNLDFQIVEILSQSVPLSKIQDILDAPKQNLRKSLSNIHTTLEKFKQSLLIKTATTNQNQKLIDAINALDIKALDINAIDGIYAEIAQTQQNIDAAELKQMKAMVAEGELIQQAIDDISAINKLFTQCIDDKITFFDEISKETQAIIQKKYQAIKPFWIKENNGKVPVVAVDNLLSTTSWLSRTTSWFGRAFSDLKSKTLGGATKLSIATLLQEKPEIELLFKKKFKTINFNTELNKSIIEYVNKSSEINLSPFTEFNSLFTINELDVLDLPNEQREHIQCTTDDPDNIQIEALDQLTAQQLLDLHQWYNNKRNKFRDNATASECLLGLLDPYITEITDDNGNLHQTITKPIPPSIRQGIKNQYNQIQPYLVNANTTATQANILQFDKALVNWLNDDSNAQPIEVSALYQFINSTQAQYTQLDLDWKNRSKDLLAQSITQTSLDFNKLELINTPEQANRRNHLLKDTAFSKAIRHLRLTLHEQTHFLTDSVKRDLTVKDSDGIPYPEVNKANTLRVQNKRVIALKHFFNALYKIERTFVHLESLDNTMMQTQYVTYASLAYWELHQLYLTSNQLIKDPYYSELLKDMVDQAQLFFAKLNDSSAYKTPAEDIYYYKAMKSDGLWYVLNAFFITPKFIQKLNGYNLTGDELRKVQAKALETEDKIKTIIENSDSYFKIFLKTPTILRLLEQLKGKAFEFASAIHDAAMNNLDEIKSTVIASMLLEADQWERKLGLKAGLCSDKLNQILSEFYKGLIEPMGLDSKTHLGLVCNLNPIHQRIQQLNDTMQHKQIQLSKLNDEYSSVIELNNAINDYEQLKSLQSYTSRPEVEQIHKLQAKKLLQTMKKSYSTAKFLLIREQDQDKHAVSLMHSKIDALLKNPDDEYDCRLSAPIKELAAELSERYAGLRASYQMEVDICTDQLSYLNDLEQKQHVDNEKYLHQYTEKAFKIQVKEICSSQIGLIHVDIAYNKALFEELNKYRIPMVEHTKKQEDIKLTFELLLQDQARLFEQANYSKYYQLNSIIESLNQIKSHLSQVTQRNYNTYTDDKKTVLAKNALIEELAAIASDDTIGIEVRIQKIQETVNSHHFINTMMRQRVYEEWCWGYFVQCILSFLEALHLYTPVRTKFLQKITDAANDTPSMAVLTTQIGLFSSLATGSTQANPTAPAPAQDPTAELDERAAPTTI